MADSSSGPMYWGREDEECMGDRADGDGDFLAALLSRICFSLFVKAAVEDWTPAEGELSVPLNGTTDINGWCCGGADFDCALDDCFDALVSFAVSFSLMSCLRLSLEAVDLSCILTVDVSTGLLERKSTRVSDCWRVDEEGWGGEGKLEGSDDVGGEGGGDGGGEWGGE